MKFITKLTIVSLGWTKQYYGIIGADGIKIKYAWDPIDTGTWIFLISE